MPKQFAIIETCESRLLFATTWYVAPTGSDAANTGTIDKPFASLNGVVWRLKPGDTVYLRGGTYHWSEQQSIYADGTSTGHLSVMSYPGERAIIDGANVLTGWRDAMSISGDYVDLKNVNVQNSHGNGVVVYQANNVSISGCIISRSNDGGIWVGGDAAFSNVLIEKNVVYENSQKTATIRPAGGGWAEGISISKGTNIVVRGNTVYNNNGEGIGLWNSNRANNIIEANRVYDNYSVNVYVYNTVGGTVRNNFIFSKNNPAYYRDGVSASAIQIATEMGAPYPVSSGNSLYNNIVVGTSWGFYYGNYMTGGGLVDTLIANNTFVNCTSGSVNIDFSAKSSNSRFVNNIVYQANGKALTRINNTPGVIFDHNAWFGGTVETKAKSTTDILTNPQFTNLGGLTIADYIPRTTSRVINHGTIITTITQDIFATARIKGISTDIGAIEV